MKRYEAKQLADNALKELDEALRSGHSETLKKYLNAMSQFHSYSWNNCILISIQMPDASLVAGFRRWLQLGRHVRKGESGIGILAPLAFRKEVEAENGEQRTESGIRGFRVVHVFDISQTDGDELPSFAKLRGEPGVFLERLEALARKNGIELRYEPLPLGTKGVSTKGTIVVSSDLMDAERFAVLCHELAHERMHDGIRRKESSKTVLETEAEAVSYVVCRALGLDCSTRSADYIQLYRGSAETLAESLELIQKASAKLIAELQAEPKDAEVQRDGTADGLTRLPNQVVSTDA